MKGKIAVHALVAVILTASLTLNAKPIMSESRMWVVDDDGPADFHAIGEAVDNVGDGDIVFVKNGTYYEHVLVNRSISLIGEEAEATIIDGNGTGTVLRVAAPNVLLENLTLQNAGSMPGMACVYVYCTLNTTIQRNILNTGYYGILLWKDCRDATFTKNHISNSFYGIACEQGSINISIRENHVFSNKCVGISARGGSENITVIDNVVENVKGPTTGNAIDLWSTYNALIEGNRILLYSDKGISIDGGCTNIVVDSNNLTDGEEGIHVQDARAVTVIGNTLRNQRMSNVTGTGISVGSLSGPCAIIGNTIADNHEAISLATSGHTIFHNSFVNNTFQADISGSSIWDDGYPCGGNYWSDYLGTDLYSGSCQNETGADGLGDTQYTIDDSNADHYPLMKSQAPCPWLSIDPQIVTAYKIGDEFNITLKINEVDPRIRLTGAHVRLRYNATMLDTRESWAFEGDFMRNSAARANLSTSFKAWVEEGEIIIDLMILSSSEWPKTAFPVGTGNLITVRFNATFQNPREDMNSTLKITDVRLTDPENAEVSMDIQKTEEQGQCLYSVSAPTLPSDLNKDGAVNILDVSIVAVAFGSKPGDPNWNVTADLNEDGQINIVDVATVAKDYGKTM